MISYDYKNNYIITLVDTSQNNIKGSLCMDNFAHHQFLLVDKSGYAISQEKIEAPFCAGDVIYVSAGRRFGIRCNGEMNVRHIAFTGRNIRPLLHYCHFGEFRVTSLPRESNADAIFDKIFALNASSSNHKIISLSEALYSLLAVLGEANIENDNYVFDKRSLILNPVIDFMQDHYRNPRLSYKEFIASLGMSKSELDDAFIDVFSMTADEFYKHLRMNNAKHLLFFYHFSGTDYVAANMGYETTKEFKTDFYEHFNIMPDDFVNLYWKN